jgi:TonB-dependent starch-binding outer membrane protein SusC
MNKTLSTLICQRFWPMAMGGFAKSALAVLLTVLSLQLQAQSLAISGKVTDEQGAPMPGVNVIVKGTTNGTTTDVEGQYKLTANDPNSILVFSFIGYVSQETPINGQTILNISMAPDILSLSEVVVVGYGTQKRSSVVGSIGSVTPKDLADLPVPSMEQAIQGRVAGVVVTNNGAPGEAPIVRIRGINSINYASNPLYVVDGIIGVGNFQIFDNKDIESIEVLKDASSAAIYGSRASAGVVIITTKKGSSDGKIHVNLDSYVGVQSAWRKLDLLNTQQYVQYGTDLLHNSGAGVPSKFNNLDDPIYAGSSQTFGETNTDWQNELFQSATITQHHLSLSGGSDKSKYFASVGYFKQDGIMLGTGFERYNARFNSEHKVSKSVTFGQTLLVATGFQKQEQSAGGRSQITNMIRMLPYLPVLNPTNLGGYGGPLGDESDPQNPVRAALQDLNQVTNVRVLGSLYLNANITKWLTYRFNVGVDFNSQRTYTFLPAYSEGVNGKTSIFVGDGRNLYFSPIYTNQLTFDKTYGKHSINATGVIEYQTQLGLGTSIGGNTSANNLTEASGLSGVGGSGGRGEFAIYSYIGRLNYEYAGKYILSATIRRDGASNFAPGFKFGNFPSIGLGWRISEESFMRGVPSISELKLRASYGSMGNGSAGGFYPYQTSVNSNTTANLGGKGVNGSYYDVLGNKKLAWEITDMTSIGADVGLFNNKITFSAEYYYRKTDNLILGVNPASSAGFSGATNANIGKMTNSGFDFQAGYKNISKELKWNANANIGFVKNEVLALSSPKAFLDRGQNPDFGGFDITRTEAGHAVQSFYGWQTAGLFQSFDDVANSPTQTATKTQPGDIKFVDVNNDGQINSDDRVYLGSFLPNFAYGINLGANYKNWDFVAFFQGVSGNRIYNGTKVIDQGMLRLFNASTDVLRAWTPTNPNTDVPRAVSGDPNGNARTSNRFIEDGSYLRLKNISLGYSLSTETLQNLTNNTLTKFRVYVAAQNLLTFTNYTGYDPEVGSRFNASLTQGIDYGQFPQARTIMVGVQVGF